MDIPFSRYTEKLPEEFSVRHKITETTEKKNFHLHRQMEIQTVDKMVSGAIP